MFSENIVWLWRPPNQTQTSDKENTWGQLGGFLMFQHIKSCDFFRNTCGQWKGTLRHNLGFWKRVAGSIKCDNLCFWQFLLWQYSVYRGVGNIHCGNIWSVVFWQYWFATVFVTIFCLCIVIPVIFLCGDIRSIAFGNFDCSNVWFIVDWQYWFLQYFYFVSSIISLGHILGLSKAQLAWFW